MKVLNPNLDLDSFFRSVAVSNKRLLLLDYDGTLAPFRINRDEAVPYRGVREMVRAIQVHCGTRVVLVSGRSIDDLLPLLGVDPPPEIWGSHGWERLSAERGHEPVPLEDRTIEALEEAQILIAKAGLADRCEKKHGCLALHWRGLKPAEIEDVRERVQESWDRISIDSSLSLVEFDGGLELRARGRDKATVTRTLLSEMGHGTVCAYLGDDFTDEDAFRELSGKHLGVLVRKGYRPTQADLWIQPPEELLEFLERWIDAGNQSADRNRTRRKAEQTSNGKGEQP
jgi:trehalose-phosphatase